jgi:hypothetical protein
MPMLSYLDYSVLDTLLTSEIRCGRRQVASRNAAGDAWPGKVQRAGPARAVGLGISPKGCFGRFSPCPTPANPQLPQRVSMCVSARKVGITNAFGAIQAIQRGDLQPR